MSNEKVLCSHELVIRFDQHEGNRVSWYVVPDDKVLNTQELSLTDLAEFNAPLATMGIRALWKMCVDGLIYTSLEQANSIQMDAEKRTTSGSLMESQELPPEGATIN